MKQVILLFFIVISLFSSAEEKKINAAWYNVYQINIGNVKEAKAQIDMHFRTMNELGINTVFFMVKSPNGRAYYKSKILKPILNSDYVTNQNSKNQFDVLEYVIQKCCQYGMAVHPYINIFAEQGYFLEENPSFAEKDSKGKPYCWSSPAVKEVQDRILSVIEEIVTNYKVDGIQLDRIRYEDIYGGFNDTSVSLYKSQYGKDPSLKDADFMKFKKQLITDFVASAVKKVKSINPQLSVSAAVFHSPKTAENVVQDFAKWIDIEGFDALYTMSYTNNNTSFNQFLKDNSAIFNGKNSKTKLIIGVGAYYKDMTPEILKEQVKTALQDKNVSGICYFSAYNLFEDRFFNAFKDFRP